MSFFAELKRRNVIRMAGLYLVGAWLVIQIAETLLPAFDVPGWVLRALILLLVIGFLPALVMSWVFQLTPDGLMRDDNPAQAASLAPQTARRMDRVLLVTMALALAYFAFDKFVMPPSQPAHSAATSLAADTGLTTPTAQAEVEPTKTESIAVLAFANLSADKDNEYFSDGVAEEILSALSRIDGLKVAGRTSSFYFKGRNEPLATIGSTLGVAHVLEGSVRKQGDRLRISAKLLRVSDGFQMWSETFDGTDADIFSLQESIAQKVTSELQVALNAGQQNRLVNAGTRNPEAYALHLKATDIFNRRARAELAAGIAAAEQAVALDPGFARAVSRLATLYFTDSSYHDATSSAQEALRLDPTLGEPHAVLGAMDIDRGHYSLAKKALDESLRLEPKDPTANFWQATFYCQLGYIERCEAGLDQTLAIDPLLPNALAWRARLWVSSGDVQAAEAMSNRARDLGLSWSAMSMVWVAFGRGDLARARAETEALLAANSVDAVADAAKAIAAARVGDVESRVEALRIIDQYLADTPPPIGSIIPLALVWLGEVDRGLGLMDSVSSRNSVVFTTEVLGTRLYPQVWASPAFPDFLRRNGIAAYWDEFGPPPHCTKNATGDYRCE